MKNCFVKIINTLIIKLQLFVKDLESTNLSQKPIVLMNLLPSGPHGPVPLRLPSKVL